MTQLLETIKSKLAPQLGAGIESIWVDDSAARSVIYIETSNVRNATLNPIFDAQHEIEGAYENFYFVVNCVELEEKRKNGMVWQLL